MNTLTTAQVSIAEQIEKALGSETSLRVLHLLGKEPDKTFTKYAIMKGTGLNFTDARRILEKLISIGWVTKHSFKTVAYQINLENTTVKALLDFFLEVGYL